MSYETIKSIEVLLRSGKGDTGRLEYILDRIRKGKYLYLSDQNYLDDLLNSNLVQDNEIEIKKSEHSNTLVDELRYELSNLNKKLEQIEREKKIKMEEIERQKNIKEHYTKRKPDTSFSQKKTEPKSEDIALALSIVLGLVGLSGIGQMYLGKIAKGTGILLISIILIGSSIYFLLTRISQVSFHSLSILNSIIFVIPIGYLGLYIYQIFDARKMCKIYNNYLLENGKSPPWW